MSHIEQEQLYKQIFDALPVGLILIAQDYSIYAWNQWMANNTHIDIKKAIGHSLHSLYPNYSNARFDWALDVVIHNGHPQVLSTILNKYVIPIPLAKTAYIDLGMMQQYVEILPFHYHTQNMALVVIQDVSDKTHQKNTLITMAARFEESSLLDALTGLYNRRFLWKFLENEMQTAKRKNYYVTCCLFDLDHFKIINDELGHNAGDELLRSFAELILANTRSSDRVIRYGGEEFIVILTHLTTKASIQWGDRIRKKLEAKKQHGSVKRKITCSGGIAIYKPSAPDISAEKLVNQADLELYKAKEQGRNCIVIDGKIV